MLQKDLVLNQDFLLLGTPNLALERRHLLLLYAALLHREVEYVALSRDTSEADLKQRKEVFHHGTVYVNQAPVRAAIHGRLLILDGIEKAERNVLPTLNNLLENRELPLDDGTMLVSPDVYDRHKMGISVHPDFRVAAIGSLAEGESASLDPPLRSRFQARLVSSVDAGDMLGESVFHSSSMITVVQSLIFPWNKTNDSNNSSGKRCVAGNVRHANSERNGGINRRHWRCFSSIDSKCYTIHRNVSTEHIASCRSEGSRNWDKWRYDWGSRRESLI
jgi:hypothetical protein